MEENKSVFEELSGKDYVENQRQKLENKREFVEAKFENMRPKIEKMITRLNEKLTKDHFNESEISDSEAEFGRQEPQDMIYAETKASKEVLKKEIITLKGIIEQYREEI